MTQQRRVAILLEDLYEELELWYPYYRLLEAGYEPVLVAPAAKTYHGKKGSYPARPDRTTDSVSADDFVGLIVPGGYSPDLMRRHQPTIDLLAAVGRQGKPVAAICHAGWALISAGLVAGKRVTSFHSIRDDMQNAGAEWVDAEVVVDGNLVTSRTPADLPAFMVALLERLAG
jgi:protease I